VIPFDTFNLFYRDERERLISAYREPTVELTIAGGSLS
jgi:hypothetical protein